LARTSDIGLLRQVVPDQCSIRMVGR
jgi:hypothetical protein